MSAKLRRAVGDARDRLHSRLSARRAVAGAAVAAIPAAGLAMAAWAGGPAWLAPVAVVAGASAGAAWGALTRVTMAEAAVALDRAVGAGDRVATAWEFAARKERGDLAARVATDGLAALRPAAFAWTFRRRDALAALAAAAMALLALASPAKPSGARGEARGPRIVNEERERLARSAAEAQAAAALSGSTDAEAAAKRAAELANGAAGQDAGQVAADFAREAARIRATASGLRSTNPEAARLLDRVADRLDAGSARLTETSTGAATASATAPPGTDAGSGTAGASGTFTTTTSVNPTAPADPFALTRPTWPAEYDGAVEQYFSEEKR